MDFSAKNNWLIDQLKWRYATKKFDPNKTITSEDWTALKQSLVLAPSSFGLQPWKFAVVTQPSLRAQLVEHSWGQTQPVECSHFVILLVRKTIDSEYVDSFMQRIASVRGVPLDRLEGYRSVVLQFIERLTPVQAQAWMSRQVYIALGQLMTSAAVLGIDACPMEGINPQEYDRLLGFQDTSYSTLVACALGYRAADDKAAAQEKVRFDAQDLFIEFS